MADIAARLTDIHRRHGSGAIGWYYGNPGAFSYSHTLGLSMLMNAFGPRLHVFTAGSPGRQQPLRRQPDAVRIAARRCRCPTSCAPICWSSIGANPVVSHGSVLTVPRIKDRMHDIVKRGGRVLVIDPRRTETAAQFEWLGIIPDGDAFLLLSLLARAVRRQPRRPRRHWPGRPTASRGWTHLAGPFSPGGHRGAHRHRPRHRARRCAHDLASTAAGRGVRPGGHQYR